MSAPVSIFFCTLWACASLSFAGGWAYWLRMAKLFDNSYLNRMTAFPLPGRLAYAACHFLLMLTITSDGIDRYPNGLTLACLALIMLFIAPLSFPKIADMWRS